MLEKKFHTKTMYLHDFDHRCQDRDGNAQIPTYEQPISNKYSPK